MLPTVVLVGRPNVGKSTLFNRLTRSRSAIVADTPGVTRDRHYARGRMGERPFLVVDTGGFEPAATENVISQMAQQTLLAVAEADAVVLLTDARQGVSAQDMVIAQRLRESGQRIWLAVNKAEGLNRAIAGAEFHELGLGDPWPISAAHGDGVGALIDAVLESLPEPEIEPPMSDKRPRIAVVGRPNAGKSTLVNALLGQDRVITSEVAGTTRDSINIDFDHRGRIYTLIDTAGLRRRSRVSEAVEKFSVIRALHAIEDANVSILVIDALEGLSDQDANIAGYVIEAGRAAVVAVNKCDALSPRERALLKAEVQRRLKFLDFARFHYISARSATGLDALMRAVDEAYRAAYLKMPTPRLTRIIREAIAAYPPPRKGMNRNVANLTIQGESREGVRIGEVNFESLNSGSGTSATVAGTALSTSGKTVGHRVLGGGRAALLVENADLLQLHNFSLHNPHVRSSAYDNQAETLYFNTSQTPAAARLVAKQMNFLSQQDTLQLKGYVWVYQSLVAGNVDFIWGGVMAALFEECEIRSVFDPASSSPGYILQARAVAGDKGFVFLNSRLTAGPGVSQAYLARSGGTASSSYIDNIAFINNQMDAHILAVGWCVGTGTSKTGVGTGACGTNPPSYAGTANGGATDAAGWRESGSTDLSGVALNAAARLNSQSVKVAGVPTPILLAKQMDSPAGYGSRAEIFYSSTLATGAPGGWAPVP